MSQLSIGKRIEREHKGTVQFLKQYEKQHGKLPPASKIYESIAREHVSEHKNYYTKLKKAKL